MSGWNYQEVSTKFQKAKPGALIMDTVSSLADDPSPELYRFLGIVDNPRPENLIGGWNTFGVKLENVRTGSIKIISADDRFGMYPIVTQAVVDRMASRAVTLKEDLDKYEYILNLIKTHAHADLRIRVQYLQE